MAHQWSGWPGAYCLKCGVEHALENAIALGWYTPIQDHPNGGEWKSPAHQRIVQLCDGNCAAEMPPEEFEKVRAECQQLGQHLE